LNDGQLRSILPEFHFNNILTNSRLDDGTNTVTEETRGRVHKARAQRYKREMICYEAGALHQAMA